MMKSIPALILVSIIAAVPASAVESEECKAMFVQTAEGMTSDGGTLTLNGVNPIIIYFCDRPVRAAGHMSFDAFIEFVTQAEDNPDARNLGA